MNRKKCKARGSRVTNSNQKYSTISGKDAKEVGEMVTADHDGTSGGLHDDCQRTNYLQVVWLLREKLNDLVDGDKGEFPGLGLRSLLDMAASLNIVFVDPQMLNPVLWRTLPKELLHLVLARLPVPDITGLRCLSREWRRDMATVNSGINQACDEASPTMFAIFSYKHSMLEGFPDPEFLVTICTQKSQYSYRLYPGDPIRHEYRWDDMGAHDGGLVYFVSTWRLSKDNPLCIVVVNLLTRVQRKLPPLQYVYSTPPKMLHIEVDSETKCYKVVVVGKNLKGRPTIEIYDYGARQWTKATPPLGSIFGVAYRWEYQNRYWSFRSKSTTRSVYDFAEGQLKSSVDEDPSCIESLMTFRKDCMFVLHMNILYCGEILQAEGHCITKYRMQSNGKNWVKERSYLCSPFEVLLAEFPLSLWTLKACEDFLMVFPCMLGCYWSCFWLLNLATGEWSSIPNCFKGHGLHTFFISRAFWNVMP